jgi:hypothetical protein
MPWSSERSSRQTPCPIARRELVCPFHSYHARFVGRVIADPLTYASRSIVAPWSSTPPTLRQTYSPAFSPLD